MCRHFIPIAAVALALSIPLERAANAQQRRTAPAASAPPRTLLSRTLAVEWEGVSLRKQLSGLSSQQGIRVFLDRRIDPNQVVALRVFPPQPLGLILHRVAARTRSAVVPVGSVLYVAPQPQAWQLTAQHEQLRSEWMRGSSSAMRRSQPLKWSTGSSPREILVDLCARYGVTLQERERVPHDVWPAYDLGQVPFPDAVTLLLSGFDYEARWDLHQQTLFVRHRTGDPPRRGKGAFFAAPGLDRSSLTKRFAPLSLRWRRRGPWWLAEGSVDGLSQINDYFGRFEIAARPHDASRSRLTFTVRQQPLGAVLKTLQQQLQITFELTDAASERLHQRVSFSVKRATLAETLKAALDPAGLTFQQEGRRVRVKVK